MAAACPPGRLLIALSGGPDSTALLLALAESRPDVAAAHFDHALRPGSDQDAAHVAELAAALGLELISARRSAPLERGSLQAAARAARYGFLERARLEAGAGHVLLGHTADDLVESVLLHLLRGSGLAGLRGMPARRGAYVRPLLDSWRVEVEAFLRERAVEPLRDPSNLDRRFARVRVRLGLLPALEQARPGIAERLHRVARVAAARQEELELRAGGADLRAMPPVVRAEAFRQLYAGAGGRLPALSRRHLAAMERVFWSTEARSVDLPGGLAFRVEGGAARVEDRDGQVKPRPSSRLLRKPCRGCADPLAAHLRPGLDLRVGYRTPGLRIKAVGRPTRKLQDLFVDARVPRSERDRYPLVFAGERLAWVPGLAVAAEFAAGAGGWSEHVVLKSANRPSRGVSA